MEQNLRRMKPARESDGQTTEDEWEHLPPDQQTGQSRNNHSHRTGSSQSRTPSQYNGTSGSQPDLFWGCFDHRKVFNPFKRHSSPTPEELLTKQMEEIAQRAEARRKKNLEQEREIQQSREVFQSDMADYDARTEQEKLRAREELERYERESEARRRQQKRDDELELERKKQELSEDTEAEARRLEEYFKRRNDEQEKELRKRESERIQMSIDQNREIRGIRKETENKEIEFHKKLEEDRIRREREDEDFAELVKKIELEHREKSEKLRKQWESQMEQQKKQYEYMMEQMAFRRWSMNMERNFDNRLNYLRSASRQIKLIYSDFADSLITVREYLKNAKDVNESRFKVLESRVKELREILEKQRDLMSDEVMNLDDMQTKTEWTFLSDIKNVLVTVQESCDSMLDEINSNFVFFDQDYLKSGKALSEMNKQFDSVLSSYSRIPTMDSLKKQHDLNKESSSSSSKGQEEHTNDDGQVFIIEEPEY